MFHFFEEENLLLSLPKCKKKLAGEFDLKDNENERCENVLLKGI